MWGEGLSEQLYCTKLSYLLLVSLTVYIVLIRAFQFVIQSCISSPGLLLSCTTQQRLQDKGVDAQHINNLTPPNQQLRYAINRD